MKNETSARQVSQPFPAQSVSNRPTTQVESMTAAVAESIEYLKKALEEHREQIAPVTRSEEPTPESNKAQPEEMLVPVATNLRAFKKSIDEVRGQLQSLTQRVEA
jgi:hypothetical protein